MDLLHIFGPICVETLDEFFPAFAVCDNKKTKEPIIIRICTPGGESSAGLAIYDLIKGAKHNMVIEAYGECSSIGMVLLQAADLRLVSSSCRALVHNGSLEVSEGNMAGSHLKAAAKEVKRLDEFIKRLFAERTGLSLKDIKKLLDEDTVLTAQELVAKKFADGIVGQEKETS